MNLGFLVSGGGTNLQAILDACASGKLDAKPTVVISNNSGARALQRARDAGVDTAHFSSVTHPDPELLDKAICTEMLSHDVDLIVLAGYMKKLGPQTLAAFHNRIINVHPAPLPEFGGPGMYGSNLHGAVLAAGVENSAVTIHFVDEEYDHGEVIAETPVPVLPGDDIESLSTRVLAEEHKLYVETIGKIASGTIRLPV